MRLALGALALACAAWAGTVTDLVESVRGGLRAKLPDAEIAFTVKQAKLTARLEDAVIEELESEGAGPQTIEGLERQREISRALPIPREAPRLFDAPPGPAQEERTRVLETTRQTALRYTADLPNFICTETVRRYDDQKNPLTWRARDTLTVEVAYSEKGERYKLISIDNKPTKKTLARTGGFRSNGEFGSVLREIFAPESAATFVWERWSNLHGRLTCVFSYRIDQAHSKYTLNLGSLLKRYHATTGMRGLVYIDRETSQVMRFSDEADGLPPNWPVLRTPALLDYDFADVGGQKFLLPRRVDTRVVMKDHQVRNVTEFGDYRKFSSEATLTFEKQD